MDCGKYWRILVGVLQSVLIIQTSIHDAPFQYSQITDEFGSAVPVTT